MSTFDRETILDATVNFIPLAMIAFFTVLYLLMDPWQDPFLITATSYALLVVPFVALAALTYLTMRII